MIYLYLRLEVMLMAITQEMIDRINELAKKKKTEAFPKKKLPSRRFFTAKPPPNAGASR